MPTTGSKNATKKRPSAIVKASKKATSKAKPAAPEPKARKKSTKKKTSKSKPVRAAKTK